MTTTTTTTSTTTTNPTTNEQKPANVEVVIDKKAQKAGEKMLRAQKEQEIFNNFATPLVGTYLNLTQEPALIKCPSCGIEEYSEVIEELKWWATEINRFLGCLFVTLCCCCCFDYKLPCKSSDRNHYCKNCGCYFGRAMRIPPLKNNKMLKQ